MKLAQTGGRSHQAPFLTASEPTEVRSHALSACRIVSVGKRRDGRTRYWCLRHRADATAKYGRPAANCMAAHITPIRLQDILELRIDAYKGGVALWGALPPVYDTTVFPVEHGIHVHARRTTSAAKEMDRTVRAVRIFGDQAPKEGVAISELDAIYYLISSVFQQRMKDIRCPRCGYAHSDRDWFSVHPHRLHRCAGCGRQFRGDGAAVGNPILGLRKALGIEERALKVPDRPLVIRQRDYPAGIQIWGSSPAILWTNRSQEEEGIHVHAFERNADDPEHPTIDETFSTVTIDGVELDPTKVRILMAQRALPFLKGRVLSIQCPKCGTPQFDGGAFAFAPTALRACGRCRLEFGASGRLRKIIANPLVDVLNELAKTAPRAPQLHDPPPDLGDSVA
jgi:hypothetical protein